MRPITKIVLCVVLVALAGGLFVSLLLGRGFSARTRPLAAEAFLARNLRRLAIPAGARAEKNPVPASPEVLRDAMAHFADHCAICHANDGGGDTEIGKSLYPPAPDMREDPTQSLSDGELFYITHNGIRFTGMPAWGPDDPAKDRGSWELVHFIRRLPDLTPDELAEMRTMNPKSAHEWEEEEEARRFLEGGGDAAAPHGHGAPHRH